MCIHLPRAWIFSMAFSAKLVYTFPWELYSNRQFSGSDNKCRMKSGFPPLLATVGAPNFGLGSLDMTYLVVPSLLLLRQSSHLIPGIPWSSAIFQIRNLQSPSPYTVNDSKLRDAWLKLKSLSLIFIWNYGKLECVKNMKSNMSWLCHA